MQYHARRSSTGLIVVAYIYICRHTTSLPLATAVPPGLGLAWAQTVRSDTVRLSDSSARRRRTRAAPAASGHMSHAASGERPRQLRGVPAYSTPAGTLLDAQAGDAPAAAGAARTARSRARPPTRDVEAARARGLRGVRVAQHGAARAGFALAAGGAGGSGTAAGGFCREYANVAQHRGAATTRCSASGSNALSRASVP